MLIDPFFRINSGVLEQYVVVSWGRPSGRAPFSGIPAFGGIQHI